MASGRTSEILLGLLGGTAFAAAVALERVLGFDTTHLGTGHWTRLLSPYLGYGFVIAAVVKRKRRMAGALTLQDGFGSGAITASIYAVLATLVSIGYLKVAGPEVIQAVKNYEIERYAHSGAKAEDIANRTLQIESLYSGTALSSLLQFMTFLVWGLAVAAITAMILRRKPRPTGNVAYRRK